MAVDVLAQHRVAEAVDHVRELGDDAGLMSARRLEHEGVDVRLHHAAEFLEHEMLVFHLVGEAAGLEQALAIPGQGRGQICQRRSSSGMATCACVRSVSSHSLRNARSIGLESHVLGMLDQAVVLGVEDVVDGGEPIFSFTRPSPAMKCASSSSLS